VDDRVATGQGLSDVAFDVLCGSLLGDASINVNSSHLQVAHSERQSGYAEWKAEVLGELDVGVQYLSVAAVAGGAPVHGAVHLRSKASRALRILRREFYRGRKIVPDWIEDRLNDRMLAIWFLDDGHMRIRSGKRRALAEIASNSFDASELQVLIRALARLGLPATTSRGRIYFNADASRTLSERIAPFTPPAMRYKLDPEVERQIPHDPALYRPADRRVLYDEVIVEDVTDHPRTDTTFFCLDVEDTHNFVTAGGVVHNCRPPGNRDPQPDEIESCEGHLFRQIELIQPKVVATLGNFATKLLSGKPTGITRVHGQEQEVVLGGRSVLLYPLFHPAAALYTPRTLDVLQGDFARLPDLLGRPSEPPPEPEPPAEPAATQPVQLGLF
jgi:hypothetical protein